MACCRCLHRHRCTKLAFFRPSHRLQDGWLFTPAAGAGWAATVQVRIVDYEFGITSLLNKKKLLQEGNVREVDNTHIQLAGDVDLQTRNVESVTFV